MCDGGVWISTVVLKFFSENRIFSYNSVGMMFEWTGHKGNARLMTSPTSIPVVAEWSASGNGRCPNEMK